MKNSILEEIKKQVAFQEELAKQLGITKNTKINYYTIPEELEKDVKEFATPIMEKVMENFDRHEREAAEELADAEVLEHFAEKYPDQKREILDTLYKIKKSIMRTKILNDGVRPDGRKLEQIRPIWCEVGMLPRVHGSAVFTRGETQVMTTVTLGSLRDMQKLEGLDEEDEKRYILNIPDDYEVKNKVIEMGIV